MEEMGGMTCYLCLTLKGGGGGCDSIGRDDDDDIKEEECEDKYVLHRNIV